MSKTEVKEKVVMDLGDGIPEEVKQEGQDLQKALDERLSRWKGPISGINKNGRPKGMSVFKDKTARQIREAELLSLLRKMKPLMSKSIMAASKIIDNEQASDQNKLKASALLLTHYRNLLLDLYKQDDDSVAEEIQSTPVFSMKIVNDIEDVEEK